MEEIIINGEAYVKKAAGYKPSDHVCVIAQNGWIFEGMKQPADGDGMLKLAAAHVVRKWSNGMGIGGFATAEHKDDYTLDAICGSGSICIMTDKVIAVVPLEW